MVRYLSLLLFIGLVLGQNQVDPLEAARRAHAAAEKAQAEADAYTEAAIQAAAEKAAAQARSNAKQAKEDEKARKLAETKAAEEAELDAIAKAAGDEARRKIAEELGLDYEKDIMLKTAVIYLRNGERINGDIVEIVNGTLLSDLVAAGFSADKYIVVRTERENRKRIRYRDINYILHNNNGLTDYLQAAGKELEPKPEPVIWSNSPDEIHLSGLFVFVTSTPNRASVFIDKIPKGSTPITLKNLSVGHHTIRIVKYGYIPHEEQINISLLSINQTYTVSLDKDSNNKVNRTATRKSNSNEKARWRQYEREQGAIHVTTSQKIKEEVNATNFGYTIDLSTGSPRFVNPTLNNWNSNVDMRIGIEFPKSIKILITKLRFGIEIGTFFFQNTSGETIVYDYYAGQYIQVTSNNTYSGITAMGLMSFFPDNPGKIKIGAGIVGSSAGFMLEASYGFRVGKKLKIWGGIRSTEALNAETADGITLGRAGWIDGCIGITYN